MEAQPQGQRNRLKVNVYDAIISAWGIVQVRLRLAGVEIDYTSRVGTIAGKAMYLG